MFFSINKNWQGLSRRSLFAAIQARNGTTNFATQQITAATLSSKPGFPPSGEREGGFWIGGDAYSAPVAAVKQGSTTTYYAVLRDYLGNITNVVEEGDILNPDKYSFDAWGRRRNPANWSYSLGSEPALFAGRGFTSHEWLPWFNLYNMLSAAKSRCKSGNGRLGVYPAVSGNPVVGRFLSADNYVQAPGFTQSFNRYSYVLNNPLKYTDPSGELPFLATLAIVVAGNYAIGWLDNVINKGMSAKEAFKNTNFIMGVDFNPGDMSKQNNYGFTNSQVDAHNEPKKDQERTEKVNKKLDDVRQAYGNVWHDASMSNLLPQKGDPVLEPLHGFWDYSSYYLFGRSYGMYSVDTQGRVIGLQPITGIAPTPGFAKGTKIIQYGGHTLSKNTLNTLNISKEQGKYAIESMKKANRLPANFHGNIGSDGSYWSKTWEYIDNILHYLY